MVLRRESGDWRLEAEEKKELRERRRRDSWDGDCSNDPTRPVETAGVPRPGRGKRHWDPGHKAVSGLNLAPVGISLESCGRPTCGRLTRHGNKPH